MKNKAAFKALQSRRKRARAAYLALSHPFSSKAASDDAIKHHLWNFLSGSSDDEFEKGMPLLYRTQRVRAELAASAASLDGILSKEIYPIVEPVRLLRLLRIIVSSERDLVSRFRTSQRDFERSVFKGDFERAGEVLDRVELESGQSLWLVRNRVLVLTLQNKVGGVQEYVDSCNEATKDRFLAFVINCFLLLSTDPLLHLGEIVFSTIRELRQAGLVPWADFLVLLLVPVPLFRKQSHLACLPVFQCIPLVDQVALLPGLIATIEVSEDDAELSREARRLRLELHEIPLTRPSEEQVDSLVRQYETSCPETCAAFAANARIALGDSLAIANIAAKAEEMAQPSVTYANPLGPREEIHQSLRSIYGMDKGHTQAIDDLRRAAVRLHHFTEGGLIQLALYNAIPNYFPRDERSYLAQLSPLRVGLSTRLNEAIADGVDALLGLPYASSFEQLPRFRQIKVLIQEAIVSRDRADVAPLLQEYQQSSPLTRDALEVSAAALIAISSMEQALALCARTLSADSNAFTALPLRELVAYIETNRIASIDAAVVVYFFVKNIDSSKEYLLNETYEDLLFSLGVERPSELISRQSSVSPEEQILFRDISTIETMDFLGCFASSNDLRSERIALLDWLRDTGHVSREQHRSEVDEIIGQVIVDSGATEFSVHKIDVNDAALRRKLTDEIASLLSFYRSAVEDDRFIGVPLDDEGTPGAIVAGDKNTTLGKIYTLVQEAFLFDDKHGLDKNLSAEIRHGFFANLIRSRPEDRHLLTETDEDGHYKSNSFWRTANGILTEDLLNKVDEYLREFSAGFNQLVAEAEEWMKISQGPAKNERAFNFSLRLDDFSLLRRQVDASTSADEVIGLCCALLWKATEVALAEIRERIHVDFKNRMDGLFDKLIASLEQTGAALAELMDAVHLTKNGIREDITTVGEWFRRGSTFASRRRSAAELIDISVECFGRVRGISFQPTKIVEVSFSQQFLHDRQMKALVLALINLYENALRHSGHTQTDIRIDAITDGFRSRISVSNPVTSEVRRKLLDGDLARAQALVEAAPASELVRTEGGTGLSKVRNQLSTISERLELSVDLVDSTFKATIEYDESFDR